MSDTTLRPGAREDGQVNCLLAHPLNERDLVNLGLDPATPANVGDVITLDVFKAQSLIGAGFVQVDPEDNAAVIAYLHTPVAPSEAVSADSSAGAPVGDPASGNVSTGTIEDPDGGPFADLRGQALDDALTERGLSTSGTVAEKRQRLAEYVPAPVGEDTTES
jgi:hypothetical protein